MNSTALVAGAGGFIGGHLVNLLRSKGYSKIIAVDKKPLSEWFQVHPATNIRSLCLDLSHPEDRRVAVRGVNDVYNLAADMGGMGFIEKFRIECMRSVLINTNLIEAAYQAGVERYFFASSACVYNTSLQQGYSSTLKETDAYPAMAERGYGWERIVNSDLISTPVNLGSDKSVSVNDLVNIVEDIASDMLARERVSLARVYDTSAPRGVVGRHFYSF